MNFINVDKGRVNMMKVKELADLAVCTAALFVVQAALAFLPNIELVSLLLIVFTLTFGKKVLYIIYGFALLEGFLYGFHLWWINYLYVWTVLALAAHLSRRRTHPAYWAVLSGFFGLCFGALCSFPYFFIGWSGAAAGTSRLAGGLHSMAAWWITGIPFDLLHCAGNFVCALVLFRPLSLLMKKLKLSLYESKSM